jgi:hypothetical protein
MLRSRYEAVLRIFDGVPDPTESRTLMNNFTAFVGADSRASYEQLVEQRLRPSNRVNVP